MISRTIEQRQIAAPRVTHAHVASFFFGEKSGAAWRLDATL